MLLGPPPAHVDEARRAEARRAKVRLNVQAYRRRQKEKEERAWAEESQSSTSSVISITAPPSRDERAGIARRSEVMADLETTLQISSSTLP